MGYEGGNVPKEMADCAMADILSTILGELLLVFVVSKEKEKRTFVSVFSCGDFFLRSFGREFFPCPERDFEESKRDFENSHSSTPHNNNIIIIR